MADAESVGLGPPPALAEELFGERLPLAVKFAAALAGPGVERGLIGPRELPRLWDRHLLNCAVLGPEFPAGARVIDVGSGAGLPGLVLAIARPDLSLVLMEPMLRRVAWLNEMVELLGITGTEVCHGRAEAFWGKVSAPYVTARAVAPLATLALWCSGLISEGGWLLAMKGSRVAEEIARDQQALTAAGFGPAQAVQLGAGLVPEPTYLARAQLRTVVALPAEGTSRPRKLSRGPSRKNPSLGG